MRKTSRAFIGIVFSALFGIFITTAGLSYDSGCSNTSETFYEGSTSACATDEQVTVTYETIVDPWAHKCYSGSHEGEFFSHSKHIITRTCETCTMGYYYGPVSKKQEGDEQDPQPTRFCCDYFHLANLDPLTVDGNKDITPDRTTFSREYCLDGHFVCPSGYLRLVDPNAVEDASAKKLKDDGWWVQQGSRNSKKYPNYVCVPSWNSGGQYGSYSTPQGYHFAGNYCGSVGYGDDNNTTFLNCRLYTDVNSDGCKVGDTQGKAREYVKLKADRSYGGSGATYGYDIKAGYWFGYVWPGSGYTFPDGTEGYEYANVSNWEHDSWTFEALPGYKRNIDDGTCSQCASGTYSEGGAVNLCSECQPGTHQNQIGQTSCLACEEGTFQMNSGARWCAAAPTGAEVNEEKTAISRCSNGTYLSLGGRACLPCPFYGQTDGSLSAILALNDTNANQSTACHSDYCNPTEQTACTFEAPWTDSNGNKYYTETCGIGSGNTIGNFGVNMTTSGTCETNIVNNLLSWLVSAGYAATDANGGDQGTFWSDTSYNGGKLFWWNGNGSNSTRIYPLAIAQLIRKQSWFESCLNYSTSSEEMPTNSRFW